MRRREFFTLTTGAAAWAFSARAKNTVSKTVGYLSTASNPSGGAKIFLDGLRHGLRETGWVDGENVTILFRGAGPDNQRLSKMAAELIQLPVDVIAASNLAAVSAAERSTLKIPMIGNISGASKLQSSYLSGLYGPGKNFTGIIGRSDSLAVIQFGLLCEVAPKGSLIAILTDSGTSPVHDTIRAEAERRGRKIAFISISKDDLNAAFTDISQQGAGALFVLAKPPFVWRDHKAITSRALRLRIPAIYGEREFALAGGLMTYSLDHSSDVSSLASMLAKS